MLQTGQFDKLAELGYSCVAEDKKLFSELKTSLRLSLEAFEIWEKRTKEQGIPIIRENILKLPLLVETYYTRLALALDQAAPPLQNGQIPPVREISPPTAGYPGHGSNLQYSTPQTGVNN